MPLSAFIDPLLPPTGLALLALAAMLLGRRLRRVAVAALVALVLLSMPIVTMPLLAALDLPPAPPPDPAPQAIVILSADIVRIGDQAVDIGPLTLERERIGAALHRSTGLPLLVSGGIVQVPPQVARLMERSLPDDFRVPVRWREDRSLTTWENAKFSAEILKPEGITRVYVVTHPWHMRRALVAFRAAGLDAVPAPTLPDQWPEMRFSELIPRASSWTRAYLAIHEWVGLLAYRLRA